MIYSKEKMKFWQEIFFHNKRRKHNIPFATADAGKGLSPHRTDSFWGRKRYIKTAAAISSRTVFSPAPTPRESSISLEARLWRVSEFDRLRFLQRRLFCSYRRLPALRSPQLRQKSQIVFLPIHRRRLHTDVLLGTRMQWRRFFVFLGQLQFHHTENTGITRCPVSLSKASLFARSAPLDALPSNMTARSSKVAFLP